MQQVKFKTLEDFLLSGEQVAILEEERERLRSKTVLHEASVVRALPMIDYEGNIIPHFKMIIKTSGTDREYYLNILNTDFDNLNNESRLGLYDDKNNDFYSDDKNINFYYRPYLYELKDSERINLYEISPQKHELIEEIVSRLEQLVTNNRLEITQQEQDQIKQDVLDNFKNHRNDIAQYIKLSFEDNEKDTFVSDSVSDKEVLNDINFVKIKSENNSDYIDQIVSQIWDDESNNYLRNDKRLRLRKLKMNEYLNIPEIAEHRRMIELIKGLGENVKTVCADFMINGETVRDVKLKTEYIFTYLNEYFTCYMDVKDRKKFTDDPSLYNIKELRYRGKTFYVNSLL